MKLLKRLLIHESVSGLDADEPETTEIHRELVLRKPLLRAVYDSFYDEIIETAVSTPYGPLVELGSGGGYIQKILPRVITSDILRLRHINLVTSAELLPFGNSSVSAFSIYFTISKSRVSFYTRFRGA
tara:strand:+ start:61 stop:444 length:384 start_codon:yes stop_codon:yes gene_type:complete